MKTEKKEIKFNKSRAAETSKPQISLEDFPRPIIDLISQNLGPRDGQALKCTSKTIWSSCNLRTLFFDERWSLQKFLIEYGVLREEDLGELREVETMDFLMEERMNNYEANYENPRASLKLYRNFFAVKSLTIKFPSIQNYLRVYASFSPT